MKARDSGTAKLTPRITNRITVDGTGCWIWGGTIHNGYGRVFADGRQNYVHRLVYRALVDEVAADLQLDHLCRNRACCNPAHLEPVTARTNLFRSPVAPAAVNARKTHCKRGHEFTPENTTMLTAGGRRCRECHRMHCREVKRRRRMRLAGMDAPC